MRELRLVGFVFLECTVTSLIYPALMQLISLPGDDEVHTLYEIHWALHRFPETFVLIQDFATQVPPHVIDNRQIPFY